VDFRISKGEIGNLFRNEDHANFMECGDQILRNFLNGLVIHLRGTKENPKNAMDVIKQNQEMIKKNISNKPSSAEKSKTDFKPKVVPEKTKGKAEQNNGAKPSFNPKNKKPVQKIQVVEKVNYKNGKNKKS
jgi:hypothetical protein